MFISFCDMSGTVSVSNVDKKMLMFLIIVFMTFYMRKLSMTEV